MVRDTDKSWEVWERYGESQPHEPRLCMQISVVPNFWRLLLPKLSGQWESFAFDHIYGNLNNNFIPMKEK